MTSVSSIIVEIKAVGDQFASAWNSYKKQVDDFNKSIQNGNVALTKLAEGFAALIGFQQLKDSVNAANDLNVATSQLDQVLKTTGQFSASTREELLKLADTEEELTGVHKDQIVALQSVLFSYGATADQVKRLVPLVLDAAARLGRAPEAIARTLGEITQGDTSALSSFGLSIASAGDKVKTFDGIMQLLGGRFDGAAQKANEAAGPFGDFDDRVYTLKQNLGELLLIPVNAFFERVNMQLQKTSEWFNNLKGNPDLIANLKDLADDLALVAVKAGPLLFIGLALRGLFYALSPLTALFREALFVLTGSFQKLTLEVGFNYALLNQWKVLVGTEAVGAVARLTAGLRLLGGALGIVGSFFGGWQLGKIIDQMKAGGQTVSQWAQETEIEMIATFNQTLAYVEYFWNQTKKFFEEGFYNLDIIVHAGVLKLAEAWNKLPFVKKIDTAGLEANLTEAYDKLQAVQQRDNKKTLDDTLRQINAKAQQDIATIQNLATKTGAKKIAAGAPPTVYNVEGSGLSDEQQKALSGAQTLMDQIHKTFLQSTLSNEALLKREYDDALDNIKKKIKDDELYAIAKFELDKIYAAKKDELDRKQSEQEAENKRAELEGKIRGIGSNPLLTNNEKAQQQLPLQKQLLDLDNQRMDTLNQMIADSQTDAEARLNAERELNQLTSSRADLEQQIADEQGRNSFIYNLKAQWTSFYNSVSNTMPDVANFAMSPFVGMKQGLSSAIDTLLEKGSTAKQFFQSIALSIGQSMIGAFSQMVANWIMSHVVMAAVSKLFGLETVADQLSAEQLKTIITQEAILERMGIRTGEAAHDAAMTGTQAGVHAAGEASKTGATGIHAFLRGAIRLGETVFHGILVGIQVATHVAGEIAKTAITVAQALIRGMIYVVVAAVAALEAMAGIPVVGPVLAVVAAAGMIAAGVALLGGFEKGGYTGDGPVGQVAGVVHRGEYVIPANRVQSHLPLLQAIHSGALADMAAPRTLQSIPQPAQSQQPSQSGGKSPYKISNYVFHDSGKMARAVEQDDAHELWVANVAAKTFQKIRG